MLFYFSDENIARYDYQSLERLPDIIIQSESSDKLDQVVLSPDGERLAGYDALWSWDIETWTLTNLEKYTSLVVDELIWMPDSVTFLTQSDEVNFTHWHSVSGESLASWQIDSRVTAFAISPDGLIVAMGTHQGHLIFRNLSTGDHNTVEFAHQDWIARLIWDWDTGLLYSEGADGVIHVWQYP